MRILKIVVFCMLVMAATVAIAQQIQTDYDHTTDFSKYKTFMWIMEPKPANPLVRQRIIDDVTAALTGKGLTLVTANADVAVAAHAGNIALTVDAEEAERLELSLELIEHVARSPQL